jgi:hypothetical protein
VTNSPVPKELLDLLATVNIPQADRLVVRPTDKLPWIRRHEVDAIDPTAAIFSNVSFTGTNLRLSPAERGEGVSKTVLSRFCLQTMKRD